MNYLDFKKYILNESKLPKNIKKEFNKFFDTSKGPKNENKYIEYKKDVYNNLINKLKTDYQEELNNILSKLNIEEEILFNYVYGNLKKFHYMNTDIDEKAVFSFDKEEKEEEKITKENPKTVNANIKDFQELSNGINKIKNGTVELFLRLDDNNSIKAEVNESTGEILWLQINDKRTDKVTKELIDKIKTRMYE